MRSELAKLEAKVMAIHNATQGVWQHISIILQNFDSAILS